MGKQLQASLTVLALQSLKCAFLSVFLLWGANFALWRGL